MMSAKAQFWSRLKPLLERRSRSSGNTVTTILIVVAALGLTRFASHVSRQAEKGEPANDIAACINYRCELLHIWLPQKLTQLATRQAQTQFARRHEETRCVLDPQDQKSLWYALTVRVHQAGCPASDVSYVRRLNEESRYFPELLDILASAAGTSSYGPTSDFSTASVHIFADQFLKREPREVVAELLRNSAAAQNLSP
jgi:hypothetical protein